MLDTEITNDFNDDFYDFFLAIKKTFEDGSLSLQDLAKMLNSKKYPDDFDSTRSRIRDIILNYGVGSSEKERYATYRLIDNELFKYVKTKPFLFNKVVYATKVLNHSTTSKSYLNKYIAAICGTNKVPKSNNNTYEYLFEKIQNNISKNIEALNIKIKSTKVFESLLDKKIYKTYFNLSNQKLAECVAFLIDPVQNYYSFNGNDYTSCKYQDLKTNFDKVLTGENFQYANQHDETRSFYNIKETNEPYWQVGNLVKGPQYYITFGSNKNDARTFTCCERKIMTKVGYLDGHVYNFLITFPPCKNCEKAIEYTIFYHNAEFNIRYYDREYKCLKLYGAKTYHQLSDEGYFK